MLYTYQAHSNFHVVLYASMDNTCTEINCLCMYMYVYMHVAQLGGRDATAGQLYYVPSFCVYIRRAV